MGGGGVKGAYKSAEPPKFEAKSADPTMVLSKFGSTKSSTMKSQSSIRIKSTKLNPQSSKNIR